MLEGNDKLFYSKAGAKPVEIILLSARGQSLFLKCVTSYFDQFSKLFFSCFSPITCCESLEHKFPLNIPLLLIVKLIMVDMFSSTNPRHVVCLSIINENNVHIYSMTCPRQRGATLRRFFEPRLWYCKQFDNTKKQGFKS